MKDFYWFEFWRLAVCFGPRVPQFWHQPGIWIGYRTKDYIGKRKKFAPRFNKQWTLKL